MTVRNAVFIALLVFTSIFYASEAFQKTVEIDLVSKWSTPLIAEIGEYFAKKGNQNFWNFVESLDADISYEDNKETYDEVMARASRQLSGADLSFLRLFTSIRYHSPFVYTLMHLGRSKVPGDCDAFVQVGGVISCDLDLIPSLVQSYTPSDVLILDKDHKHPANHNREGKYAVLYARIGSAVFKQGHSSLKQLAAEGAVNYVFRHYQKRLPKSISLSGYGVELAIKSTEYKATDDSKIETKEELIEKDKMDIHGLNFSSLKQLHPSSASDLDNLKTHLLEDASQMTPLKVWQLQDLSLQAGQKVISEQPSNQLTFLRDLCQNFPSRAKQLVKVKVKEDFKHAIKENQMNFQDSLEIGPGDDYLMLNGLKVAIEQLDMVTLTDLLQREHAFVTDVASITSKYQVHSLHNLIYFDNSEATAARDFGLDIRTQSVLYINNLEKDRQYSGWPSSVQDLLRPTFPGMLRHLSRNLFNLVFFLDPLDKRSHDTLVFIESFYVHSVPVRIGFVFVKEEKEEENKEEERGEERDEERERDDVRDLLVQAFCNINNINGPTQAFAFLKKVRKHDVLTEATVTDAMSSHLTQSTITTIINHQSTCYDLEDSTQKYRHSGLSTTPKVLMNGVPMADEEVLSDFEESLVKVIFQQTSELQRDVFEGRLTDSQDTTEYLMQRSNIKARLNTHIFNSPPNFLRFDHANQAKSFIDPLSSSSSPPSSSLSSPPLTYYHTLSNELFSEGMASNLHYLSKNEEQDFQLITWWVVVDLQTTQGRSLYANALKHLKHSKKIRIGLIHNTANPNSPSPLSLAIQTALHTLPHNVAKNFINKLLKEENAVKIASGKATVRDFAVGNMNVEELLVEMDHHVKVLAIHSLFCRQVLGFAASEKGIISNGRIYGPFASTTEFIGTDFELMEQVATNQFTHTIEKHLKSVKNITANRKSDLSMKLESVFLSPETKEPRKRITFTKPHLTTIHIPPSSPQLASLNIVAIINPASKAAQKIVPIIMVLNDLFNTDVHIFLNCQEKLSEMPLKSYYRFVLEPEVMFKGSSSEAFTAHFSDLPHTSLLTLNMHTPDSWLVESIYSPYDLDNILLSEADTNVYAQFELDKILLEGHCYDTMSGSPPRGLQFTLGSSTEQTVDTIVMANLGYFQLKATPGLWFLNLREGKSKDLYEIISLDDKTASTHDVLITMDSFKGRTLQVKVAKKRGREFEELLSDDEEESFGLWESLSSSLGGGGTKSGDDEQINVFSLASGHLYERFLRVMMLSVVKNTQSKVKFWFLKNFLSPTFKNFIPYMASRYHFEYELVQYKWPRWLHQQTEKQRMIWGYKILFLDVLFPLNVSKIIFVDADQTVRADLKELNQLDLEGAPYGYTPFCDSRKEMDGYRFWRSGYWASHLGHRKYHISALYVVDLKKFRKVAAGDRLRGQYQGLSQDPNSLSNLDQDLPNNMIHQVAIKSLPQEWLWCETWCSDADKPRAKTIDLCNNPKTKEPKLDAALRIVPEWRENDAEIRQLMDSISKMEGHEGADDDADGADGAGVAEGKDEKVGAEKEEEAKKDDHTEL